MSEEAGPYHVDEHGITGSDGFRGPGISWFIGRDKLKEATDLCGLANEAYAEGKKTAEAELTKLQVQPSTGSNLSWVGGDHRCRHGIALNQISAIEDRHEELEAELAAIRLYLGVPAEETVLDFLKAKTALALEVASEMWAADGGTK